MKTGVLLALVLLITISPLHIARASDHDNALVAYVWQQWRGLVEKHCSDLDPSLVLSIIAQESRGQADAMRLERNGNYSVGLMQIHATSWRPPISYLRKPENNIAYGCNVLRQVLAKDDDIRFVVAAYNCGEVKVTQNRCGSYGGYYYADLVLNHWKPKFERLYYRVNIYNRYFNEFCNDCLSTGLQRY